MWSGNCTLKLRRSAGIVPPPRAVHWPVYLLWWSYALLLAISPLPALAQEKVLTDKDVILPNGCLWNNVTFELNCSQLGLTRIPPIDLSISETATQLNLVNNSLETLTVDEMESFKKVTLLDLRSNRLRVIEDEVFSARVLPRLQTLFLSRNMLTRLPRDVFKFTVFSTLDLSHNNFKYPPPALASTSQIDTLLLNNNPFDGLQMDSLANVSSLQTLELSACNLTTENLAPEVFRDFTGLRTLYLDQNYFQHISREMFSSLPSVRDLYLQQCGIETIEGRAFRELENLNGLHLAHNNMSELFPNSFRDLSMKNLDLSYCGIQNIRKGAFRTRITNRLYLSHNNITVIHNKDFKELEKVHYIDLSYSNIAVIMGSPFLLLDELQELHLQYNLLENDDITVSTFNSSGELTYLDLTGNRLTSIPDLNGKYFPHLHQLDIGGNQITHISNNHLRNMTSLYVLVLKENPIEYIENEAFLECRQVTDLNLDFTRIKRLPDMSGMARLTDLHIVYSKLVEFPVDFCTTNSRLIIIEATANDIETFANFSGCKNLFSLALDHNHITEIPPGSLRGLTKLDILKLHDNDIDYIAPDVFCDLGILKALTLYHNRISYLPRGIFSSLTAIRKLNLGFNLLETLPEGMFANNTLLSSLWLNDNKLRTIHPSAFGQKPYLELLNMSSNNFCFLDFPTEGFPSLRVLSLEQLWCLHNVPNPNKMPNAIEVYYTYAYHCCLWEDTLDSDVYENDTVFPTTPPSYATGEVTLPTEIVTLSTVDPFDKDCTSEGAPPDQDFIDSIVKLYNLSIVWGPDCRFTLEGPMTIGLTADDIANLQNGQPTTFVDNDPVIIGTESEGIFEGVNQLRNHYVPPPPYMPFQEITCYPRPNPLTPCDNLLDPWPIRVTIWAVWVLILSGNIAILFIMIAARQKMDVSHSFICVLAFSNTFLGIYLAFLAMVDIRTIGDRSFYQSALEWQKGSGCQTAGFLAIFSSQLSVYILVILTIERLHHMITNITSPYQKERNRLSLALTLICIGFVYAFILALLPLRGVEVNAYDKVAVCLPFATESATDRNYILSVLTLNMLGIAIVLLAFLFALSYLFRPSLSRKKKWDILKGTIKLSLLMVTTFLCWFPIGIVGYTASLQRPMIDAGQAKYFIVFIFPINALFSPIIYAFITRSFRRNIWWFVTCCPSTKNRKLNAQNFRLIQRQTTSTPTSILSTDFPFGQSPRSLTAEELRTLRQSRRSNSYSVQYNPTTSKQQFCSTPPTPGSIAQMGRRASLPAVFESNTASNITEKDHFVEPSNTGFGLRFAPGLLSQIDSSLPNLPEENEEAPSNQDDNGSSSPQTHVVLRKLSTVHESDETSTTSEERLELNESQQDRQANEEHFDATGNEHSSLTPAVMSSALSRSYSRDIDKAEVGCSGTHPSTFGVQAGPKKKCKDCPMLKENELDESSKTAGANSSGFHYVKLQENSSKKGHSDQLQVVNPRFSSHYPALCSETDV